MSKAEPKTTQHQRQDAHGHHGWLMIACCIPMLVVAVALVASGVVGVGFVFVALMCMAMMGLMMGGMSHGGGDEGNRRDVGPPRLRAGAARVLSRGASPRENQQSLSRTKHPTGRPTPQASHASCHTSASSARAARQPGLSHAARSITRLRNGWGESRSVGRARRPAGRSTTR